MHFFIDESGTFVQGSEWGVICSLALPHKALGPVRREINFRSKSWPKQNGEIKGGLLDASQLAALVDILYRYDALLHSCAIYMAGESFAEIKHHQIRQCENITVHLGPEHHPDAVKEIWKLRRTLEVMPPQLYLQCVTLSELVSQAVEETANYFAQRRPRELALFEWKIDAKDPNKITSQEKWWQDTLGPLLETRSMGQPIGFVKHPDFDFTHLHKSYEIEKDQWFPDQPRQKLRGIDIGKIITNKVVFEDSRKDILLQAIDVLANYSRRLISGKLDHPEAAQLLGRIQIRRRYGRKNSTAQTLRIISISKKLCKALPDDLRTKLDLMAKHGRSMLR
ncbi:DUF3800 domain-containing protein [Methylobacterium sp. Leaf123]|uniref:DUF3800 domain-containing protein n=1 Tax=Methylobacterium sp. Leaf123 TaxID=1736264 RepID=UPI000A7D9DC8|nr:DUF3800 domain-containing protein [Methylobacterium sp. Leaf123]